MGVRRELGGLEFGGGGGAVGLGDARRGGRGDWEPKHVAMSAAVEGRIAPASI